MPATVREHALLALLAFDAVLLATFELFFLPARFDGRILPEIGDLPAPITVLVAAATTPLLVSVTARLLRPRLAIVPLVAWVLTLLVLGVLGPGRDLVLLEDWRTLLLLAAGVLPAAIVLGGALGRARTAGRAAPGPAGTRERAAGPANTGATDGTGKTKRAGKAGSRG